MTHAEARLEEALAAARRTGRATEGEEAHDAFLADYDREVNAVGRIAAERLRAADVRTDVKIALAPGPSSLWRKVVDGGGAQESGWHVVDGIRTYWKDDHGDGYIVRPLALLTDGRIVAYCPTGRADREHVPARAQWPEVVDHVAALLDRHGVA